MTLQNYYIPQSLLININIYLNYRMLQRHLLLSDTSSSGNHAQSINNSSSTNTPIQNTTNNTLYSTQSTKSINSVTGEQHTIINNPGNNNLNLRTQPSQQNNNSNKFLGIEIAALIKYGIIAIIVLIIVYVIYKLYKRKKAKQDYNQNPQKFAHLPALTFSQDYHLKHTKMENFSFSDKQPVIKQEQSLIGKSYAVTFKDIGENNYSVVYYHRRQNITCYFEVQILSLNGQIQIGFCPVDKFDKLQSREKIGTYGLSINTNGQLICQGVRQYKYNISPSYGDVIGIGITVEGKKVMTERRGWISINGKLKNPPTSEEVNKWISSIKISAEEKNNYDMQEKQKQEKVENTENKGDKKQEEQKKKKEQEKKRKEEDLLKQKISLKTYNKFEYYPVIRYSNGMGDKPTKIIVNVGGQIFRMNDKKFRSGLLKDKPILFDDNQQYD